MGMLGIPCTAMASQSLPAADSCQQAEGHWRLMKGALCNKAAASTPYLLCSSRPTCMQAFIQKAITNHDNVVEQKNHLQQKLDAAAKQVSSI